MKALHITNLFGVLLVTFATFNSHGNQIGCMMPSEDRMLGNGRSMSRGGDITDLSNCTLIGNINSPVNKQNIPCTDAGRKQAQEANMQYLNSLFSKTENEWANALYCKNGTVHTTPSVEGTPERVSPPLGQVPKDADHVEVDHAGYHQDADGNPATSPLDDAYSDKYRVPICAVNTGPNGGIACHEPKISDKLSDFADNLNGIEGEIREAKEKKNNNSSEKVDNPEPEPSPTSDDVAPEKDKSKDKKKDKAKKKDKEKDNSKNKKKDTPKKEKSSKTNNYSLKTASIPTTTTTHHCTKFEFVRDQRAGDVMWHKIYRCTECGKEKMVDVKNGEAIDDVIADNKKAEAFDEKRDELLQATQKAVDNITTTDTPKKSSPKVINWKDYLTDY